MKKALLAVAATAALMLFGSVAAAGATTFDGSCKLKATVHFSPSIEALPKQVSYTVTAGGKADGFSVEGQTGIAPWDDSTCHGKLNGQEYIGRAAVSAAGQGLLACDVGDLDGDGTLTFLDAGKKNARPTLSFHLDTPFVLRFPLFDITGNGGGKAEGTTEFWTTKNPAGFTNCVADGTLTPETIATSPADGVSDAMFQGYIQSQSGGISG
ncbi:MAG TPA: hypothetical protein VJT75_19695 [Thermoleophilaceae bacterium]|nr:hypothetical protein [Thermoleophilaceae bacterium]